MKTITDEMFKKAEHNTIFATGYAEDTAEELNLWQEGLLYRWVAVKGTVDDWAVYCDYTCRTDEFIKHLGNKVPEASVRNIIRVSDELFERYRS